MRPSVSVEGTEVRELSVTMRSYLEKTFNALLGGSFVNEERNIKGNLLEPPKFLRKSFGTARRQKRSYDAIFIALTTCGCQPT